MNGFEILNNPFLNKGTAFTKEERQKYDLTGIGSLTLVSSKMVPKR